MSFSPILRPNSGINRVETKMKEKDNRAHNLGLHLPEELSQIVLVFDRACGWNVQRRIPDPRLEPLTFFSFNLVS